MASTTICGHDISQLHYAKETANSHISILPSDVLSLIFAIACKHDAIFSAVPAALCLSHVSQNWQSVMLSNGYLWASIVLHRFQLPPGMNIASDVSPTYDPRLNILALYITRSGSSPLHITTSSSNWKEDSSVSRLLGLYRNDPLWSYVPQFTERIQTISHRFVRYMQDIQAHSLLLLQNVSGLRNLTLCNPDKAWYFGSKNGLYPTALETFTLKHFPVDFTLQRASANRNLRSLTVHDPLSSVAAGDVSRARFIQPELTKFEIHISQSWSINKQFYGHNHFNPTSAFEELMDCYTAPRLDILCIELPTDISRDAERHNLEHYEEHPLSAWPQAEITSFLARSPKLTRLFLSLPGASAGVRAESVADILEVSPSLEWFELKEPMEFEMYKVMRWLTRFQVAEPAGAERDQMERYMRLANLKHLTLEGPMWLADDALVDMVESRVGHSNAMKWLLGTNSALAERRKSGVMMDLTFMKIVLQNRTMHETAKKSLTALRTASCYIVTESQWDCRL